MVCTGWIKRTVVLASLLMVGCAGYLPLQRYQTAEIRKQDTIADVERKINGASVQASHQFSVGDQYYLAKHYDLQIGVQQQVFYRCRPYFGCSPIVHHFPVTAPYVLIYREPGGEVVGWGTLEELSKNPDDRISDLMPALKASYAAHRAKK
ncbi:hypothetical protein ED236_02880 [Pseudomethylobacillus aquaticus]|uniref:Uncharacterized protein n=1 Tax=Pseudomethylobacillus aquaticus TaxID=2676064 RepID=A0A3N0V730_9PROT|nr:hypothetical protein [Methylobacillus flagellatus]ROH88414.1 hypothetical protein ED236_02880 [Pseudomethylobacillus aquaticus]